MPNFKPGDRVRWTSSNHYAYRKGTILIIDRIATYMPEGQTWRLRTEGGTYSDRGWLESRFELVEESPFDAAVRAYITSELQP